MAQSGYTPILIYASGTTGNTPSAANLTSSSTGAELALNYYDGKLFYKDASGNVQLLASKATSINVSSLSFGSTGLTPNTATTGAITVAGTLITSNGGTGLSSYTAGDLPYYASGTALSKLGIGTSGQILTSSGTAPQWSTLSGVAVTTFSGGTTGLTPSSATNGAITLGGTLNVASGGTGLTTLTSGYIPYGNGTSAFGSSSNLYWDSVNLGLGTGGTNNNYAGYTTLTINNTSGGIVDFNISGVRTGSVFTDSTGLNLQTRTALPTIFTTNGTEKMRLTSAGYLGVGGTSPFAKISSYVSSSGTFQSAIGATNSVDSDLTIRIKTSVTDLYNSAGALTFSTSSGENMRLTTAGYLGIGTSSPTNILTVTGTSNAPTIWNNTGGASLAVYVSPTSTSISGIGDQPQNNLWVVNSSGNYVAAYANGAERARIDSSGNLGLGVTPSAWGSGRTGFDMGTYAYVGGTAQTNTTSNMYFNGANFIYKTTNYATNYLQTSGQHQWYTAPSGTAGGTVTFTQALTLDNSGNLLLNTTSQIGSGKFSVYFVPGTSQGINFKQSTDSSSPTPMQFFNSAGTLIGSVTTTSSATAYNTSSDQRLKTNIVDAPQGNIDQIKVRSFDWIADGSHQEYGMVAQELVEVAPYAVTKPENPDEMMGVDYSKLVPMMIKEIQDLKAEVNQLKQKLGV